MIEEYYKLIGNPFRLTPDSQFGFVHRSFSRARAYLRYALDRAEGFLMITGEPGIGKTQLITDLFADLDRSKIHATLIADNQLSADDMLRLLAMDYGIQVLQANKSTVLNEIRSHLIAQYREGRRAILILDEAQGLHFSVLEELQMLSNLQIENHSLLQVFLIGQEGLRHSIQDSKMEQLRQRIIATARIEAMDEKETQEYIEYRLGVVGWHKDPAFDPNVFPLVHQYTKGIARQINHLMSRLLLKGALEEKHQLDIEDVWDVLEELQSEPLIPTATNVPLEQFRATYEASLAQSQITEEPEEPASIPTLSAEHTVAAAPSLRQANRVTAEQVVAAPRPDTSNAESSSRDRSIPPRPQPTPPIKRATPPNEAPSIKLPESEADAAKGGTDGTENASAGGRLLHWLGYAAGIALVAGAITVPWLKQEFSAPDPAPVGETATISDADTARIAREDPSPTPTESTKSAVPIEEAKALEGSATPVTTSADRAVSIEPAEPATKAEPTETAEADAAPTVTPSITVISAVSDAARAPMRTQSARNAPPLEPDITTIEPTTVAETESPSPAVRNPTDFKEAVLGGRWTSNGKPATLLPSTLNSCRHLGDGLACEGIEQTTISKHGRVRYQVEATLTGFDSEGDFQVVYRTKVALINPEGDGIGEAQPDWQISTHQANCKLVDDDLVRCSSDKGQPREYLRSP